MPFSLTTTQQVVLVADVVDRLGRPVSSTDPVVWVSSNPAVGVLTANGNTATFAATTEGNTSITATVGSVSGSASGTVTPAAAFAVNVSASVPTEQA